MLIFEVPDEFHGQNLLDIASKLFHFDYASVLFSLL